MEVWCTCHILQVRARCCLHSPESDAGARRSAASTHDVRLPEPIAMSTRTSPSTPLRQQSVLLHNLMVNFLLHRNMFRSQQNLLSSLSVQNATDLFSIKLHQTQLLWFLLCHFFLPMKPFRILELQQRFLCAMAGIHEPETNWQKDIVKMLLPVWNLDWRGRNFYFVASFFSVSQITINGTEWISWQSWSFFWVCLFIIWLPQPHFDSFTELLKGPFRKLARRSSFHKLAAPSVTSFINNQIECGPHSRLASWPVFLNDIHLLHWPKIDLSLWQHFWQCYFGNCREAGITKFHETRNNDI